MKTNWLLMSVVVLFASCENKKVEEAKLQVKIDSLVALLEDNRDMANTLNEANALLDSIDVTRDLIRHSMFEVTSYENVTSRIKELNSYVKRTEEKINNLETSLKSSKQSGASYTERIKDLKKSLEKSNEELLVLQDQIAKYKEENENLFKTVNLQQAELDDKASQITVNQNEVSRLETRVNELLVQSRKDAGDSYLAQAQAFELACSRTSFINFKKKQAARQQALDMYRMAVLYGKEEAQTKVDELTRKL